MTHNLKKLASLLLALNLLLVSAYASPLRSSEYISTCSASATAAQGGGITVTVNIYSTRNKVMTKIGVNYIAIQKSTNGGRTWSDVITIYPYMYGSGTSYTGSKVVYNGTAGTMYRAVVTFIAKDASGSDTKDVTTNSVTARS